MLRDVAGRHLQQVIVVAGHARAFEDFGARAQRLSKRSENSTACRSSRPPHRATNPADRRPVEQRHIAANEAGFVQRRARAMAGRGRQADLARQLLVLDRRVALQAGEDFPVDGVEVMESDPGRMALPAH